MSLKNMRQPAHITLGSLSILVRTTLTVVTGCRSSKAGEGRDKHGGSDHDPESHGPLGRFPVAFLFVFAD